MKKSLMIVVAMLLVSAGLVHGDVDGAIGFKPVYSTAGATGTSAGNPLAAGEIIYIDIMAYATVDVLGINSTGSLYLTLTGNAQFVGNTDYTYYSDFESRASGPPDFDPMWLGGNSMTVEPDGSLTIGGYLPPMTIQYIISPETEDEILMFGNVGVECTGTGEGTITLEVEHVAGALGLPVVATASSGYVLVSDVGALGGSITIYQTPAPVTYTLTTDVSGGANGSVSADPAGAGGEYEDGTEVTLTAAPAVGYQVSWGGDGTTSPGNPNVRTVVMDGDKTVTAGFTEIPAVTHLLTVNTGANGSVSAVPEAVGWVYEEGTSVVLTAVPAAGYYVSWSGDGTTSPSDPNVRTVVMDAVKAVTATFTEIPTVTYTLTVNVGANGAVSAVPEAVGGAYEDGTSVTLTAVAAAGFELSWSGDGTTNPSDPNERTVVMDAAKTVTATFTEIPTVTTYILTLAATEGGSVNADPAAAGGVYEEGTVVTLTAVPATGYQVGDWGGAANVPSTGSAGNTVTMDADKTVTVEFVTVPVVPDAVLTVSRFTALALGAGSDLAIVAGTVGTSEGLLATELGVAESVVMTVGPDSVSFPLSGPLGGGLYVLRNPDGSLLQLNSSSGAFTFVGRQLDLTGLSSPVALELAVGEYRAVGADSSTAIPLTFLRGTADVLEVTSARILGGGSAGSTMLINGQFAVMDRTPSLDMNDYDINVRWGTSVVDEVIPAGSLRELGQVNLYVAGAGAEGHIAYAIFNLQANTFVIVMRGLTIAPADQSGVVTFGLSFGPFAETVDYELP